MSTSRNIRLAQLEKEAPLDIRIEEALETNPEYLQLSIESYLEQYEKLLLMDKFKAQDKLMELCQDPNFKLMHSLYGMYFDDKGNEHAPSIDLIELSKMDSFQEIEKKFIGTLDTADCEGLISPDGVYYPALKSHYCLCSWLNLKGVDVRNYVRTLIVRPKSGLMFSDLTDYVYMDKDSDFTLTEQQVRAMETLFRIETKNSQFVSFHNAVEASFRYGFCRFSNMEKTRKQVQLFEDVLGKKQVDSGEILSTKIKYF